MDTLLKNIVYLLLGSNSPHKEKELKYAINFIRHKIGAPTHISPILESEPWGFESQDIFINQIVICKTNIEALDILKNIKIYEKKRGRLNNQKRYTNRPIDIDILYYNNYKIKIKGLEIPHPMIFYRNFTLKLLSYCNPYKPLQILIHDDIEKINKEYQV